MKIRQTDVALVTGASRGIGRHVALALARQGMDLVLAASSQDGLDGVATEVRAATGVTVSTLTVDLGDREQAAGLVERAVEAAGRVDVLVNNAGLEGTRRPDEMPVAELGAMTDVNLLAPMILTRMALPGMIERGRGHVVNMASMAGLLALAYQEPYNATKFGLVGFTRSLRLTALDRGWGVSASAICPGFMSGSGMYADMQNDYGVAAPAMVGDMPVELVGDAVVKAITKDVPEIIIGKNSPRVMVVASSASPRMFERMTARLDLSKPFRIIADQLSETSND